MPQLLFMVAVGAGVYSAYKWIAGKQRRRLSLPAVRKRSCGVMQKAVARGQCLRTWARLCGTRNLGLTGPRAGHKVVRPLCWRGSKR